MSQLDAARNCRALFLRLEANTSDVERKKELSRKINELRILISRLYKNENA